MTSVLKLHDTVLKVSTEAKVLIPEMPITREESKLLSHLVLCILSSQEKYEVALGAIKMLQKNDVLRIPQNRSQLNEIKRAINNTLSKPVKFTSNGKRFLRRLRFYNKKCDYIITTIQNIYLNDLTIKEILSSNDCVQETRNTIINISNGLGPKQASMFLRNVGYYSEFAVLDKHVIDYMKILGMTEVSSKGFSTIRQYQIAETTLKSYADTYNVSLLHLDMAIWTTMRTLQKLKA